MTLYGEPEICLEQFHLRGPKALTCDHIGLRYNGEVISADRWSSSCGAPLDGETFFRVILLRQRQAESCPDITDSRLPTCLPETSLPRQHSRLDDFLKIVHASDLSALATTLNQELLGSIR